MPFVRDFEVRGSLCCATRYAFTLYFVPLRLKALLSPEPTLESIVPSDSPKINAESHAHSTEAEQPRYLNLRRFRPAGVKLSSSSLFR